MNAIAQVAGVGEGLVVIFLVGASREDSWRWSFRLQSVARDLPYIGAYVSVWYQYLVLSTGLTLAYFPIKLSHSLRLEPYLHYGIFSDSSESVYIPLRPSLRINCSLSLSVAGYCAAQSFSMIKAHPHS